MQNLDNMRSHLVITLHESFLSFSHSDGRTGSIPTPNPKERADALDYVRSFYVAKGYEILIA